MRLLQVSALTKRYAGVTAVDHISFQVESGEVVGFLGVNGAGKTTTMNIITGYLSATEGTVLVNGCNVLTEPKGAKRQLGYLPEIPPLYPDLTVWENLEFSYALKRPRLERRQHLEALCKRVRIEEMKNRLVQNLSKGYRQRVGLACALIGEPPILILDEPTVGLDPVQILEIRELIRDLSTTRTVLLSSHILQEVEAVCTRIIMIDHGRIVADDATSHLMQAREKERRLVLLAGGEESQVRRVLARFPALQGLKVSPGELSGTRQYQMKAGAEELRPQLAAALVEAGIPLLELYDQKPTLEEIFLELTQQTETSKEQEKGEGTNGSGL